MSKEIDQLSDRMTVIETVLLGVNKENGLNGDIKEIKKVMYDMKSMIEKVDVDINKPDIGIVDRLKKTEKSTEDYKNFKKKIIYGIATIKVTILAIIYLVNKFNIFGV